MMKMIITWKNDSANFEENKAKIEAEFTRMGLKCLKINENHTEVMGSGSSKDYARFWNSIWHLNGYTFFYETIEKCIWYNGEPLEDVIEECKKDIQNGELVVYD